MNRIQLTGRVAAEPRRRTTDNGTAITTVRVASDRYYGGRRSVDFFDTVWWGQKAQIAEAHLRQGCLLTLNGEVTTREYTEGGRVCHSFEVVVEGFELLDGHRSADTLPAVSPPGSPPTAPPDGDGGSTVYHGLDADAYEERLLSFRPVYHPKGR